MALTEKIDDSPIGLKKFGITMAVIFGIVSFSFYRHHHQTWSLAFVVLGVIFLFLGVLKSPALKIPQKLWMGLAFLMGGVMTKVIMTVIFYVMVTPLAFFAKIFGQNFLRPKHPGQKPGSYWIPSTITKENKEEYLRQF